MAKLERLIHALSRSLGVQTALRERARRRMLARHRDQTRCERQQHQAEDEAQRLRTEAGKAEVEGDLARAQRKRRKADRKVAKAGRLEAKGTKQHNKAIVWKQRARKLTKRIEGIEDSLADARKELAELGPKVDLANNKCAGGTVAERWVKSNVTSWERCVNGGRRNAYSQLGRPDIWHPYGPGPAAGRRDDCSSYVTSQALACGFDDPNGCSFSGEGFTGTLVGAHGRWVEVSLGQMQNAGMGYVVYGSGSGHHTEAYAPSKTDKLRTIGHGSAPVDPGTVHLFGPNEVERYFVYA